jgi:bifunctional UDP-N-acetylglucosamine pyrophosphorylase/glucosamine-1-phosphate N-acetyltransferase
MATTVGVILAGGRGRRMGALTETQPKPMVTVAGRPIIEHTVRRGDGLVDSWVIVTGYLGGKIRAHFGETHEGTAIRYARQEQPLGTAHALQRGLGAIPGDADSLLVLNGDAVVPRALQRRLTTGGGPAVAVRYEDAPENGIAVLQDGQLVDAVEKPDTPPSNYVLSGTYLFEPDIAAYLDVEKSPTGEYWLTDAVRAYCDDRDVTAVTFDGPLFAANTAAELADLATLIETDEI